MYQEFNQHKKSDAIKWIIALTLIFRPSYIIPENPMKAMDINAAVISTIAVP